MILIGGENVYASEQKLKQLASKFLKKNKGGEVVSVYADDIASINEIKPLVGSVGFFSSTSLVVIKNLIKSGKKALQTEIHDYLKNYFKSPDKNIEIVFFETGKIDKRSKIYKLLKKQGQIDEYPKASQKENQAFILKFFQKNKIQFGQEIKLKLFLKLDQLPQIIIIHELEKLRLLAEFEGKKELKIADLELINQDIEEEVWELFNLALTDKQKAFSLLEKLFTQRVHFSLTIGFLASQLRQLLHYYYLPNNLKPFIKRKVSSTARKVSPQKLNLLLDKLIDLDIALKSSKLDPELGLAMYLAIV